MADNGNKTQQAGGWDFGSMTFNLQVLFGVIVAILVLSLSWNIFCCVSKFCSRGGICKPRTRRSPRQMEENPIYGNISYMQTSTTLSTGADPQYSPPLMDQHRVNSQSKTQDCYANLTLKAPRLQSGRSSPQIQYSDVVHLEGPLESEKEEESNTHANADAISTISDLYASVQNQRTKTVDTADNGEGYANHL